MPGNTAPAAPTAPVEKLLDRVRKLLALAGSPNVHEAASAAARAQALIETHRLQALLDAERVADAGQASGRDPVTDGADQPLEQARRLRKWKVFLATQLADLNGCIAYTAKVGREQQLRLAGRAADRDAVAEVWSWLVHRIELCSATEATRLSSVDGQTPDRAWHEAFRVGAAEVIVARLAEVTRETRTALGTTALVHIQPALAARKAAVDSFVEDHLNLKRGRTLRVDADGWRRGRAAGSKLPLAERD